jgi:signal transduction histidine kinase
MFDKDHWPFTPVYLSQIIDASTLAVIESGCCERLQRPLTILEQRDKSRGFDRIESINEKQRYELHCQYFRSHENRDELCKSCDIREAYRSMKAFEETGNPYREFNCHMGLIDMTYVICINKQPVAEVFSGQFMPEDGVKKIKENISNYQNRLELSITPEVENRLTQLAENLTEKPENAGDLFEREALHIQKIANSEFVSVKREWEEEFLDDIRKLPGNGGNQNLELLQDAIKQILIRVKTFCRSTYLVLFANFLEGDTVLIPVAFSGFEQKPPPSLPHFNWKKANLPLLGYNIQNYSQFSDWQADWKKSIRGDNSQLFADASCILPMSLNDRYRGVLVFGPFVEPVDLEQERRFLMDIANTVGLIALTGLEVLYLEQERHRWESSARLISHQMNTALTPITTLIGRAKSTLKYRGGSIDTEKVSGFLEQSENMVINLAHGAMKTLKSHVFHIEKDDFTFVSFPLSVMVSNCSDSFVDVAADKNREIQIDPGVEYLPDAEIDVARLTIALANLVDNAVKYSFQGTKIFIRARIVIGASIEDARAEIEVDDIGFEIHEYERRNIFEQGVRGQSVLKIGKIAGTGFGLWEARAIARAHGGDIRVACIPTNIKRREGIAHRVVFTLTVPLRQKKPK